MFNIQKDVKNEKASPRHIHRSLITRSLALARRHPEFIKPSLNYSSCAKRTNLARTARVSLVIEKTSRVWG